MWKTRYYISCPVCRCRMVRTGNKEIETLSIDNEKIYRREYRCNRCGNIRWYSESRNMYL
jgi:hypothetical protein